MLLGTMEAPRRLPSDLSPEASLRDHGLRMESCSKHPQVDPSLRERWAFTYGVDGDVRFISHHDTMRLFERALARASLPVRYTEGFNPHAKLSVVVPRPVGVASDVETIIVEFSRPIHGEDTRAALNDQMPSGMEVHGARRLQPRERLTPAQVRYRLDPAGDTESTLRSRVRAILASTEVVITRTHCKKGRTRQLDARPFIANVDVNDNAIEFTLRVTSAGTVRPGEFVELLGFDARSMTHRVRRLAIEWHDIDPRANATDDTREHKRTEED